METHARTIIKSLTWRVCGFLITMTTAWLITGRVGVAASIGLVDTGVKIISYYFHDRLWLKVQFGRKQPVEYEI
jgi:uncharacterized membrane protein